MKWIALAVATAMAVASAVVPNTHLTLAYMLMFAATAILDVLAYMLGRSCKNFANKAYRDEKKRLKRLARIYTIETVLLSLMAVVSLIIIVALVNCHG